MVFNQDEHGRDASHIENWRSGEKIWALEENGVCT